MFQMLQKEHAHM